MSAEREHEREKKQANSAPLPVPAPAEGAPRTSGESGAGSFVLVPGASVPSVPNGTGGSSKLGGLFDRKSSRKSPPPPSAYLGPLTVAGVMTVDHSSPASPRSEIPTPSFRLTPPPTSEPFDISSTSRREVTSQPPPRRIPPPTSSSTTAVPIPRPKIGRRPRTASGAIGGGSSSGSTASLVSTTRAPSVLSSNSVASTSQPPMVPGSMAFASFLPPSRGRDANTGASTSGIGVRRRRLSLSPPPHPHPPHPPSSFSSTSTKPSSSSQGKSKTQSARDRASPSVRTSVGGSSLKLDVEHDTMRAWEEELERIAVYSKRRSVHVSRGMGVGVGVPVGETA